MCLHINVLFTRALYFQNKILFKLNNGLYKQADILSSKGVAHYYTEYL